jgi:hypothetical protein
MNTEKIYEQIYKLLEDFFGKDSNVPAFYRDAWFILNNSHLFKTSSHLIAHCLREVESAIRETLSRHLLEKRGTKREEINGIIESVLHIIGDDKKEELNEIGEKWFEFVSNQNTFVHRNNIDSPHSVEEIKKRFEDFNKVFSVLLPYLYLYVHKIKQKIDELINSGNKNNVLEAFGKTIPKNPYFLSYFFSKIDSTWLPELRKPESGKSELRKEGFFSNPPEPYQEGRYIRYPTWPQIEFLKRIIKEDPKATEEVISCILDMKENRNAKILDDLIEIIAEMPLDSLNLDDKKIKDLCEKIHKWMDEADYLMYPLFLPNVLWKAIINITKIDEECGLTLVEYLLRITKHGHTVYSVLLDHRQIVMELYPEFVSITELRGLELLCSLLEKAIQYEESNLQGDEDFSHIWYNTEKKHQHKLKGILVAGILKNAKFMIENGISPLESILDVIENRPFKVFCRIARDIIEPYKHQSKHLHKRYENLINKCKKEDELPEAPYWVQLTDDKYEEYRNKFAHLKVSDIISELKVHEEPDHSIANALEEVIKDDPGKFAEEVDKFIDTHPLYQERLIRALHVLLERGISFNWEKVLKLIKEIVYKKSNEEDLLIAIARLINYTLEKNLIPIDYKNELWVVIDEILNNLNKLKIDDKIQLYDIYRGIDDLILNHLEGLAIINLIPYSLWLKKNNKIKDLNSIPEVKGRLEYYLNKQTSIVIHAVYGFYLHSLLYIDEHWTKDMIPKIFPKDSVERFFGAWCAYIQANRPNYRAYNLLKDIYAHAIENMKYDIESERNRGLVRHLVSLYGWGIISLGEPIFQRFWEKVNDDIRGSFIYYVGEGLKKDGMPSDVIQRFKELWEWRMSYIKNLSNRQDFQKELKSFIHWFVSRKFDTEWALDNLIKTVELVDEITEEHVYSALDVLVGMANKFPELVLRYLDLLTRKASEGILNLYEMRIRESIEGISKILESKGRSDLEKELKKIKETINLKLGREVFPD